MSRRTRVIIFVCTMVSFYNLYPVHDKQIPTALNLKDDVRKIYAFDILCIYFSICKK
jgi:hypothetical protein